MRHVDIDPSQTSPLGFRTEEPLAPSVPHGRRGIGQHVGSFAGQNEAETRSSRQGFGFTPSFCRDKAREKWEQTRSHEGRHVSIFRLPFPLLKVSSAIGVAERGRCGTPAFAGLCKFIGRIH